MKRSTTRLSFLATAMLAASLATGCASVNMADATQDAQRKTFTAPAEKAGIYIYRNETMGAAVKMPVTVDGQMIGQTGANTYLYKEVAPGKHKVESLTEVFNDFGPMAIRWFKDLNGNGVLDGREVLSGQMLHTTPENEAQTARGLKVVLAPSHGCVHLKPRDRDQLNTYGAFKTGTRFIVHRYDETYAPSSKP